MHHQTDQQLLHAYATEKSEAAYTVLVGRHLDLVFSAALRIVGNSAQAEEVAQEVFMALARGATRLSNRSVLSGWLHYTTRNLAANVVRSDIRRRAREQKASALNELNNSSPPDPVWCEIEPHLDAALSVLSDPDRDALMLRFFERKSAAEVAQILGLSHDAAQKRISRALERLRSYFAKHQIAIGVASLSILLSERAVDAAPANLLQAISSASSFARGGSQFSTLTHIAHLITMTTLQKFALIAAIGLVGGTGLYEARQVSGLRAQNDDLQRQLARQISDLQRQADDDAKSLAVLRAENDQLKSGESYQELMRLKGQVGQIRQQLEMLPSARAALLKRKLADMPKLTIPELQLLQEKDWERVAWDADLDTDDGVHVALSQLRFDAMEKFLNMTRPALKKYLAANNDILPANLLPLQPYYDTPVTADMLQDYVFIQTGTLSDDLSASVIKSKDNVDPDYGAARQMSMKGGGGNLWNIPRDSISDAAMAYALDNGGQIPNDPSQIASYLKTPIDPTTIQKYLPEVTSDISAYHPILEDTDLAPAFKAYAAANDGHFPNTPADLQPYVTTLQQQAAFAKFKAFYP